MKNRSQLVAALDAARLAKQHATPRSAAWYAADTKIEAITKQLYAGRSVRLDENDDDTLSEEN